MKNNHSGEAKVVIIGGGSGISVVLRGIKQLTSNISAIVTMADDGGSSGILREDLGMLPPGDIRNCILALSDTEPIMEKLMQHRFGDNCLKKHNLGNVIIAALVELTGSFEAALSQLHNIFAVKGRVLPVSLDDIVLEATLKDGTVVLGESKIPYACMKKNSKIDRLKLIPESCELFPEIKSVIEKSDVILLGPGSLYTSILPNLLVGDMVKYLKEAKAKVVYCANLLTQPGETSGLSVEDHLFELERQVGAEFIDVILVNNEKVDEGVFENYKKEGSEVIMLGDAGRERLQKRGVKIIEDALVEYKAGYIRHDALKVAELLLDQIETKIY